VYPPERVLLVETLLLQDPVDLVPVVHESQTKLAQNREAGELKTYVKAALNFLPKLYFLVSETFLLLNYL
jgi:hypothetical protein